MSASDLASFLADRGLSALDIVEALRIAEAMSAPKPRSANAERQARWRERQREEREAVTRDVTYNVTNNATGNVTASVTPPASSPAAPPGPPSPPTPTPPDGTSRARDVAQLAEAKGFAAFWLAYPTKVGKRDAALSYARAIKRIDDPDPGGVIMAGVDRAKSSRRWLQGYVPNPATWLNQDRWNDEPESAPNVRKSPSPGSDRQANFVDRLSRIDAAMAAAVEQPSG